MRYRSDFLVTGDLVLPEDILIAALSGDGVEISLTNGTKDEEGHTCDLTGTVIGEAEDLHSASQKHRSTLAERLDVLSLITESRFRIIKPTRTIEWFEGVGERRMVLFYQRDARYPPEPSLNSDFIDSVQHLSVPDGRDFVRVALKYYRYGLLDEASEDQFVKFWHALEVVAENTEETYPNAIICSECKEAVHCASCGTAAMRYPMARQAIGQLIGKIVPAQIADRVTSRQITARNTLMHGGSADSVARKCKFPLEDIVNELANLVRSAISAQLVASGPLMLGKQGTVTNMVVTMAADLIFQYSGNEPYPAEQDLPQVKVSMLSRFQDQSDT